MTGGGFVYTIRVECGGEQVHRAPASLVACLEDAVFRAVISGQTPNDGTLPSYFFTPVWNGGDSPSVSALELSFGNAPAARYDTDVVAPQARAQIQRLVKDGILESTQDVDWHLLAHEAPAAEDAPRQFSARWLAGSPCRSLFT